MWECVRALIACLLLLLRACAKKGAQQTGDGQVTVEEALRLLQRLRLMETASTRRQRVTSPGCPLLVLECFGPSAVSAFATLLLSTFCASFALVFVVVFTWTGFAVGVAVALSLSLSLLLLFLVCWRIFQAVCIALCLRMFECVCCAVYPDFCGTCEALRLLCAASLVARNNNSGALCNVAAAQEVVAQVTFATVAHSGKCCCCMLQLFPQASLATHVNASSSSSSSTRSSRSSRLTSVLQVVAAASFLQHEPVVVVVALVAASVIGAAGQQQQQLEPSLSLTICICEFRTLVGLFLLRFLIARSISASCEPILKCLRPSMRFSRL